MVLPLQDLVDLMFMLQVLKWNSTTNSLEVCGNSGWLNASLTGDGAGSAIIPQQGLVMHIESWNSDSYPGTGNTWFDLTDNNHDITLGSSVTFVSSVAGGVLNFPENANGYGRNSSMNLSNSNNTVITWVRKNSNGNNGRTVTAQSNNWLLGHHDTSRNDYYAEGWVNNISSPSIRYCLENVYWYRTYCKRCLAVVCQYYS